MSRVEYPYLLSPLFWFFRNCFRHSVIFTVTQEYNVSAKRMMAAMSHSLKCSRKMRHTTRHSTSVGKRYRNTY
jgi:hypothetical protein